MIPHLKLFRVLSDDAGTIGVLFYDGKFLCYVGELPWRDNHANISRIPTGTYKVAYLERSASGRYRDVYHVLGVPSRNGVLIHSGNWEGDTSKGYRTHTQGCLLPGSRLGKLSGQRATLASKAAVRKLHAAIGRQDFTLEVIDA